MILLSNKHSDQVFQISSLDVELQEFILQMDSKLTTHSTISRMTLLNFRILYMNHLLSKECSTSKQFNQKLKHRIRSEEVHIKNVNDKLKHK